MHAAYNLPDHIVFIIPRLANALYVQQSQNVLCAPHNVGICSQGASHVGNSGLEAINSRITILFIKGSWFKKILKTRTFWRGTYKTNAVH
jgi:hypothetical protein